MSPNFLSSDPLFLLYCLRSARVQQSFCAADSGLYLLASLGLLSEKNMRPNLYKAVSQFILLSTIEDKKRKLILSSIRGTRLNTSLRIICHRKWSIGELCDIHRTLH